MNKYNKIQEKKLLEKKVQIIKENYPQSEWTSKQKAKVKALDDINYILAKEKDCFSSIKKVYYFDIEDEWATI